MKWQNDINMNFLSIKKIAYFYQMQTICNYHMPSALTRNDSAHRDRDASTQSYLNTVRGEGDEEAARGGRGGGAGAARAGGRRGRGAGAGAGRRRPRRRARAAARG